LDTCIDRELVILLRKDDVKSFDTLYLKYHRPLYTNILKLTKDTETAQDILQEVFISLWEKRMSLDEDKPVANWLFTVSYNKSITCLKRILKEATRFTYLTNRYEATDEKEAELKEVQLSLIEGAVKHLSPQKSKVFVLCKLQGKTYDQTAKELKISRHTVKEYLSDAVINIKDYIKEHPESSTVFFCAFCTLFSL
jgi:RNA polymerase sigma factor (sigma-70 family)